MKIFLDNAANAITHPEIIKINNQLNLQINKYNNPHNNNSSDTSDKISQARHFILEECGFSTDTHYCIFTSGATGSCKLLSESIHKSITFNYLFDNHNSILGIAKCFNNNFVESFENYTHCSNGNNLVVFAYPAESNFNGKIYPLSLTKQGNIYTILDASKYLSTHPMKNLKDSNADFILFSIYKITGLPQGLGVLLIKKSAACLLDKKYFGGGTIHSIIPSTLDIVPRPFQEYYEDGTIPYMNIIIAHKALQFIQPLITSRMKETVILTNYLITNLIDLGYIVYSVWDNGSIVTFNHKTIGHKTIESLLESHGIRCRTGCFCNPGACQRAIGLSDKDLLFFRKSGKKCWDNTDTVTIEETNVSGITEKVTKHTGAVRLSVGLFTTMAETKRVIEVLHINNLPNKQTPIVTIYNKSPKLVKLFVYPVKSCNGIEITSSIIQSNGLRYDRMYAIIDSKGQLLTAKRFPQITKLKVVFNTRLAIVNRETGESIQINENFGVKINKWLTETLKLDCSLIYQSGETNFSNTSQYLLVNEQSMYDLNYRVIERYFRYQFLKPLAYLFSRWYWFIGYDRFRPNLVINSREYSEDSLESFKIKEHQFIKDMLCTRCNSTTIDNNTFARDPSFEPMTTLMGYRNNAGKVNFGVLYSCHNDKSSAVIETGTELHEMKFG